MHENVMSASALRRDLSPSNRLGIVLIGTAGRWPPNMKMAVPIAGFDDSLIIRRTKKRTQEKQVFFMLLIP
jgi:hypothetical protein